MTPVDGELYVHFVTNANVSGKGFNVEYIQADNITDNLNMSGWSLQ